MPTRSDVVDKAREYIGTPFRHQGRQKFVGVDCVGLIIAVAHELKLSKFDYRNYGREPMPGLMGDLLRQHLDLIPISEASPGDIVWMKIDVNPQHIAILSDKGMIHASSSIKRGRETGRVVEHRLSDKWRSRVFRAFRIREVSD